MGGIGMATFDYLHERRQQVLELAAKHGVISIRIFGSVARREDTEDSDVDMLVTTGSRTSSWFPAGFVLDLEALLGRHVDVVTEAGLNPLLRKQVLEEAVSL